LSWGPLLEFCALKRRQATADQSGVEPPHSKKRTPKLFSLLIAAISLARWDLGLRMLADVLGQGASLIVRLLKLSLFVAPNVAFISARIDQFSPGASTLLWHMTLLNPV
jgi:hypothetical protein